MELLVTIGDANGISLEVFIKAITQNINSKEIQKNNFTLIGNEEVIKQYISKINLNYKILDNQLIISNKVINIINIDCKYNVVFGESSKEAGYLALKSIEQATKLTLSKKFDAMITLPINKESINKTYNNFIGHTNYIANICNEKNPIMILFYKKLRIALATLHIPIYLVSKRITQKKIYQLVYNFYKTLHNDFNIINPKVAILGLNPHSGENGVIGKEEIQIINPTIEILKRKGFNVYGAFPADGFFAQMDYENYDGVIAMYHDQGLIPLKLLSRGKGVNYTANLPIVRTSPAHGTAFNLAGKNIASSESTFNAIKAAINIASNRKNITKLMYK